MAWAFAKACQPDEALFRALARAAEERLSDFNAQDLANMAWGFAKLGHVDDALFAFTIALSPASAFRSATPHRAVARGRQRAPLTLARARARGFSGGGTYFEHLGTVVDMPQGHATGPCRRAMPQGHAAGPYHKAVSQGHAIRPCRRAMP